MDSTQIHSDYITIKQLIKRYPGASEFALRGIDLRIKQGEFFGLLGPNGSGKTTLISILCGLLKATSGRVLIDHKPSPKKQRLIKPLIGLVPQDLALYPTLSLKENLHLFGKLYGLSGKLLLERMEECVETACLKKVFKKQVGTYSGGMKRRANLVIGLIHKPAILFLDEPTVNVDPQSRHVIFDILKKLNQQGSTLVYTTHYLEEAQQMCNQVAIIDQGVVQCADTPSNLIENNVGCRDLGEVFLRVTGHHLRD